MTSPEANLASGPILVIGGGGFLGRAVCKALRGDGLEVVAADLPGPDGGEGGMLGLDVSDRQAVLDTVADVAPAQIINLSYIVGPALAADLHRSVSVNLLGQVNCLDAAAATGVGRYLHAGSIGAYGPDQSYYGDRDITEEDGCPPGLHTELYGAMKAFDELLIAQYKARLDVCGFRFSVIYGAGRRHGFTSWTSALAEPIGEAGRIEIPLSAEQCISLISDEDAARLFLLAVRSRTLGPTVMNSGGHTVSGADIAALLRRKAPKKSVALRDAPGPMPFAYRFSNDRAARLLGFELAPLENL